MDLRFDNTKGHHWALRFFLVQGCTVTAQVL